MLTTEMITQTYQRIQSYVRKTPTMDIMLNEHAYNLKLELFQHTGTFKTRGAFNTALSSELPDSGLVAASGGNHGIAVAYVAHQLGISATIFVPSISSKIKQDAIRQWGASIEIVGDTYSEALTASEAFATETGALNIRAYHQLEVLAGQGTVAYEWEQQVPDLDTVLVAVGGGGLIGGICGWYQKRIRVIAVESELCPSLHASRQAGQLVDVQVGGITADSLGAKRISQKAFEMTQAYLHDNVLVTDEQVLEAQAWLWHRCRIATEPGGATAFAAILSGIYTPDPDERVGILVCGGNVNPSSLNMLTPPQA